MMFSVPLLYVVHMEIKLNEIVFFVAPNLVNFVKLACLFIWLKILQSCARRLT